MTDKITTSSESLLALPVEQILFVVQQREESINPNCDFNWHCIAEVAASRAIANSSSDQQVALLWATISVTIYDRLAQTSEMTVRPHFERDSMSVRSNMILLFGPKHGHPVLDPSVLESWFLNQVGVSVETVSSLVEQWERLQTRDQFTLFEMKQRFDVISALLSKEVFKQSDKLKQWEQVLSRLP
jgi:hypothetical protein